MNYNVVMDVKFGKIRQTGNIFQTPQISEGEGNIFSAASNLPVEKKEASNTNFNRLNDLDSNILENNAYQDIPDDMLKIEHKINILEQTLARINLETDTLGMFGDSLYVSSLIEKKLAIEKEIAEMNKKYAELGLSAKISGQIASAVKLSSKTKSGFTANVKKFIVKGILTKFSKKMNYSQSIKEALGTLSSINSNVNELIKMKTPYGETIPRYEKLTAYLNKANAIHSKISKDMKKIK